MENSNRKCVRCSKILESSYYIGELKTCNTCLEKSKEHYANNKQHMLQRSKDYRIKNIENKGRDIDYIILIIRRV
jgi:hypothetical protein